MFQNLFFRFFIIFFTAFYMIPLQSFAGVSLKNGNFYIDYTDMVISESGDDLIISRTYNSRALEHGWFGSGWGSDFETFLEVQADGTVIVHENGTGARQYFYPPKLDKKALQSVVARLVEIVMKQKGIHTQQEKNALFETLMHSRDLRNTRWKKYYKKGYVKQRVLKPGTVLTADGHLGRGTLIKTMTGYTRNDADGHEEFDAHGRMNRFIRENKPSYRLIRDYKGFPSMLVSSGGSKIHFDMNDDGTVARLWVVVDGERLEANYRYRDKTLVQSKDIDGNLYRYQYDDKFNMNAISYSNGSVMTMNYDSDLQIRMVKKRSGSISKYDYGALDPQHPNMHYYTEITKYNANGEERNRQRVEYHQAERADGSHYLQRSVSIQGNQRVDRTYNENGTPIGINRGGASANFKYNLQGQLIEKTARGKVIHLKYNTIGKISEVITYPIGEPKHIGRSQFEYDAKGQLIKGVGSTGKQVELIYDAKGQIETMRSLDATLSFDYNDNGKPVRIVQEDVGALVVSYDDDGEISSIETEGGGDHMLALTITREFQTLISIVKPSGVNFGL